MSDPIILTVSKETPVNAGWQRIPIGQAFITHDLARQIVAMAAVEERAAAKMPTQPAPEQDLQTIPGSSARTAGITLPTVGETRRGGQPAPDEQGEAAVQAIMRIEYIDNGPGARARAILAASRAGSIPGLWAEESVKAEIGMAYKHGLRDGKKCAGEGVGMQEFQRLRAELTTERSDRDRINKKWTSLCEKNEQENAKLEADLALANADCAEKQAAIEQFLGGERAADAAIAKLKADLAAMTERAENAEAKALEYVKMYQQQFDLADANGRRADQIQAELNGHRLADTVDGLKAQRDAARADVEKWKAKAETFDELRDAAVGDLGRGVGLMAKIDAVLAGHGGKS